jgi:hypothetical protein
MRQFWAWNYQRTLEVNILFKEEKPFSIEVLIPKIPWEQKLVDCSLGSLCEEKYSIFAFGQVN